MADKNKTSNSTLRASSQGKPRTSGSKPKYNFEKFIPCSKSLRDSEIPFIRIYKSGITYMSKAVLNRLKVSNESIRVAIYYDSERSSIMIRSETGPDTLKVSEHTGSGIIATARFVLELSIPRKERFLGRWDETHGGWIFQISDT